VRSSRLSRPAGRAVLATAALVAPLLGALPHAGAVSATKLSMVTPRTLHFKVVIGPANNETCDIVGDLYTPKGVNAHHRVPAILMTNGFGGSKDDQAGLAQQYARHGYVALSYSGLGFGGSGCKITLDDRDYDGKAGKQLVSFLGGAKGIAFTDAAHTHPVAPINTVIRDDLRHRKAVDDRIHAHDPRVGMVGGSYGGQIQFAIAGVDPRLDTIIPMITWNDLSYSLAPNNTAATHGVTYSTKDPGVEKFEWVSLFFGLGIADGVQGTSADPTRNTGCPNFDNRACRSKAQMDALGYPDATTMRLAQHASVESFINKIRIPTLLAQGETDTLFNLREAIATYHALRSRHVPVKMIWQSEGHSGGGSVNEFNVSADAQPSQSYEGRRFLAWFDHYLKGKRVSTGPGFAYYRDWVKFTGTGANTVQYATAKTYHPTHIQRFYFSADASLVRRTTAVKASKDLFTVAPEAPASYTETSALDQSQPVRDTSGTFVGFSSPVLRHALTIVGSPQLTFHVSAPSYAVTQRSDPAAHLVIFAKLYDVAPDGTITLQHRLISPVRIADVTKPVHVALPAVAQRIPAGHHLEIVIAASDAAYRGNSVGGPVQILTGEHALDVLSLPTS
jgi:predicted acyl esterase